MYDLSAPIFPWDNFLSSSRLVAGMSFTLVLKELFPANWVALRAYFVKEHKYYFECDVTSSLGRTM